MKKPLLIFLFIMICFTSCAVKPAEPGLNFSERIIANYRDMRIYADIVSNKHNILTLRLKSPDSMRGLTYYYKDKKFRMYYRNMKVKAEDNYLPDNAFAQCIYNALKHINCGEYEMKSADNSSAEYYGSCESGKFSFSTNASTGKITEIKIISRNLDVKFK